MTTDELRSQISDLRADASRRATAAADAATLEALRTELIGRSGRLTALLREVGRLPADERPAVGQLANEVRH